MRYLLHKLLGWHSFYIVWEGYPKHSINYRLLKQCRFCSECYIEIDDLYAEQRPISFDMNKDYVISHRQL